MSTIFDPSKLDLDVSGDDTTPASASSLEKSSALTSPAVDPLSEVVAKKQDVQKPEIQVSDTQDILGELNTPDTNTQAPTTTEWSNELPWEEKEWKVTETEAASEPIEMSDKKIIDINITSLEDIVSLIADKEYEYVLVEPEDNEVKVTFRQDNIDRSIKYIKYPVYTSILFKLKQTTNMIVEESSENQEWKWKISISSGKFLIAAKTAPGQNGERIWIKTKEDTSALKKKQVKKTSLSMIFWFLGAILLVGLILWGAFIAFIVFNAKTVEDVKFFASLGINLNDINSFISQIVTLIFSVLLFLCTAALSVGLFKFFLTKKSLRRKKIIYGLLSFFLLMITFATASAWMFIDQKIKSLPNWQEQAYGDLKIFDNDLKNSSAFGSVEALLSDTENLIGPVTLLFDLNNFQTNQARKGFTVKKYIWSFGNETQESFTPEIIKTFSDIWNYPIIVTAVGTDIKGEEIEQDIANIPAVSISHVIDIKETLTTSWGKRLAFDATNLETLGKIQWYFKETISDSNPDPSYPEWTPIDDWYEFIPGKIFFDEIYVGASIINSETTDPTIDKVILIRADGDSEITWEIAFEQSIDDELEFTFFVEDAKTDFSDGFIESYLWNISEKTYRELGDIEKADVSPKIQHIFKEYWEHDIEVVLTDSKWKTESLKKTITIQKRVQLKAPLIITDEDWEELEEVRHEEKQNEYYIDNFGIPGKIKFDARLVRPASVLYALDSVSWDVGNDGDMDAGWKSFIYEVPTEWNHTLVANYTFKHRKKQDDVIELKEFIYIEWIKQDAILDLDMKYDSNYVPVTVRFDASKSFIKNDDIVKFIYDYGDGVTEERDAINPGHTYSQAWDYTVKLTVRWKTGTSYSTSKKLILLPPPQGVSITASLKQAPVWQGIDFSSDKSEWQIVEYFWDFGDGTISTEANPTHSYKKAGDYTVKLRADFANKNSISDEVEIEIVKE